MTNKRKSEDVGKTENDKHLVLEKTSEKVMDVGQDKKKKIGNITRGKI